MIVDQYGKPLTMPFMTEIKRDILEKIYRIKFALCGNSESFEDNEKIRLLRESCGVKNTQTIKFRRNIPYFSKDA